MVIGCFLPPKPSLLQNSLTSGVVLEDFDSVFSNKFYHSHLDNICELVFILGCFSSSLIKASCVIQLYLISILFLFFFFLVQQI
jgi:hypothetical protein